MSTWPKRKVRFKHDTYNGNRWNRGDFILWHGHKEGDAASWDTEIGKGRPSWNIQDPAMISENLGDQVDINCGGIDNIYRHHDYNIAIMEAYTGKSYANYYLHGEHLIVDGKKMSKSHGNILYPDELIADGHRAEHLRFFLIATKHYRKKLNFTVEALNERAKRLDDLKATVKELTAGASTKAAGQTNGIGSSADKIIDEIPVVFERNMDNDLSVADAVGAINALLGQLRALDSKSRLIPSQRAKLLENLKRVDTVLEVLL